MIPDFLKDGNLPAGIHDASWQEVAKRFAETCHRQRLLAGLRAALDSLKYSGCRTVFLDGSFVTRKEVPNDYDGCWDTAGVNPELLDPVLLKFSDGRAAQKAKYLGELFPAQMPEGQTGAVFLNFFQIDKDTGHQKGIVAIDLGTI